METLNSHLFLVAHFSYEYSTYKYTCSANITPGGSRMCLPVGGWEGRNDDRDSDV